MDIVNIISYKICNNIQLSHIVNHFDIKRISNWIDYIMLSKKEISEMLKYDACNKQIFIYKYGIISFVDFNQTEINHILTYLKDIYLDIDYILSQKYNDLQTLIIKDKCLVLEENNHIEVEYNRNTINILSSVLAKSLEIKKLEQELDLLLDKTEKYLDYMNSGKFSLNIDSTSYLNTKIIEFEYKTIHSLGTYSRPAEIHKNDRLKETYYKIYNYFEIDERLSVIRNKMDELKEISDNYISFSFSRKNVRRDVFEILLLAMFPLFRIITSLFN